MNKPQPKPEPPDRHTGPIAKRVLILGLDGATFDVLTPLMNEGRMPRLKAAMDSGASGLLRSTSPAITPAAWTTFVTGVEPGVHGIIDFECYDPTTGDLHFNSVARRSNVRDIWDILGATGRKVGSINVPLSFPAKPVNGFLISGFEAPGPDSDFVYPRELKADVLDRWPDPTLRAHWKRSLLSRDRAFQENLAYVCQSFHQGVDMSITLGDRFGWDVLMVVLKLVDNLQHKVWKYLDPRWPHREVARREASRKCFEELDNAVGRFIDYALAHNATVLMVSDHGHGSLEGKVYPNQMLRRWGYLVMQPAPGRWFHRKGNPSAGHGINRHLPVDHGKTRACVMHSDNNAFLYINLKGRQPTGIVDPSDYESLRNELAARFQSDECVVRRPDGKTVQVFPQVDKPEELYGVRREDRPWLPDLILTPDETLAVARKMPGGPDVHWLSYRRMEGTHRPDGVFIATGPGIRHNPGVRGGLIDCAPTLLAMLGVPLPRAMTGRVMTEIFDRPSEVQYESVDAATDALPVDPAHATHREVYTEKELQDVTARLSELGYLE